MLDRRCRGAADFPALVALECRDQSLKHAGIAAEIGVQAVAEFLHGANAFAAVAAGQLVHELAAMFALPLRAKVQTMLTRAAAIRAARRRWDHAMVGAPQAKDPASPGGTRQAQHGN